MILLELIIQFQYERQAACFKEIDALVSTGANVANWLKLPSQMSEVLTEAFSVKCYSQSFITRAFNKYKRCCWAESAAVSIREISEQVYVRVWVLLVFVCSRCNKWVNSGWLRHFLTILPKSHLIKKHFYLFYICIL